MKLLQTFVVTARTLNFRKAADRLFLAQPTVTQHIRLLETELRVELFARAGKRVHLTQAGERFLEYAERLLKLYRDGVQELAGSQQGYQNRLVLAVSPLVARSTLPQAVKRFTQEHPETELLVHVALSPEIPTMVTEGRAHVGLSRLPSVGRELVSRVWYDDPVGLMVPHNGGSVDDTAPTWQELLAANRLLTHNHPGYWDDLLLAIHHQGIQVRTMGVSLVDITLRFMEEGLGISFLPHSTVWQELQAGRLREVPTPGLPVPVAATHVIYRGNEVSEPVRVFTDMLRTMKNPVGRVGA